MRPNSRNTRDKIETNHPHQQQFALTSNKENMSKNRPPPQTDMTATANSDLFNVTPKRNEMHQLIQQLDLPNESLSLSSLSQSPFQTNARRNLGARNKNNDKNSDSNSDVLGRSDYQGGNYYSNNNNMTGDNQAQNMVYTTDEQMHEGDGEDYNDQDPSPRFDDYSQNNIEEDDYSDNTSNNMTAEGNNRRRDYSKDNKTAHVDTADEDEINEFYHSKSTCRDISPDFTGHSNNEDLTVSHTLISNTNNTSQFRLENQASKIGGAQNRTFADSVINHRLLTEPASKNKHHGAGQYHRRKINETNALSNNDGYQDQYEDEDCINERDEESKEETSSDISGLNSFTQTQYSKHSKMGRHHPMQFRQIKAPSVDLTDDNLATKRSPNAGSRYQNMDHDSSLQLTPESISSKYLHSTSKSGISNIQLKTNGSNVSELVNPLKKLTSNLSNKLQSNNFSSNLNLPLAGKHNSSLSRDHELESALVEDKRHTRSAQELNQPQIINKAQEVSGLRSKGGDQQGLQFKISQLNIDNEKKKAIIQDMQNQLMEKDESIQQCIIQIQSLQNEFEDVQNHLDLLKVKTKDDSKLGPLRGKQLAKLKKDNDQFKIKIKQMEIDNCHLQNQLVEKDREYNIYENVVNQELNNRTTEIDKLKIINESLKKKIEERNQQIMNQKGEFEQYLSQIQHNDSAEIQKRDEDIKQYKKALVEKDNSLKQLAYNIKQLEDVIYQKDQAIESIGAEKQKAITESKKFKERCDDLEKELNQFKQFDNSTLFGNSINMGYNTNSVNQGSKHSQDFEIRQIRETFTQKLNKAQTDIAKWKSQCEEQKQKCAKLEEEGRRKLQESMSMQSNKLEQNQEVLNENQRLRQQYDKYMELQADIRLCFQFQENDDIMDKLDQIRQSLEEKEIIQDEYQKLCTKLQEAQNQISQLSLQTTKQAPISQFTQNLAAQKDNQIVTLQEQLRKQKDEKSKLDQEYQDMEVKFQNLHNEFKVLQQSFEVLQGNYEKVNEAKQNSEQNVENLKDQLRNMMKQKSEESGAPKDKQQQQLYDDQNKKYKKLIGMILNLDLTPDPLTQANLSLQSSFIDEFEQAASHLNDQVRLVTDQINQLNSDKQSLTKEVEQNDIKYKELQDHQAECMTKISQLNSQVIEKDRQIDVKAFENNEIENQCQKLQQAMTALQQNNMKLKADYDSLNNDLRKIRRSQDHLYKGPKISAEDKIDSGISAVKVQLENERILMTYEDQLCKLFTALNKQKQKLENLQKQNEKLVSQKDEVFEMLDTLIDSNSKMPAMNELAIQLMQRIDKIRNQKKMKSSLKDQENLQNNNDYNMRSSQMSLDDVNDDEKEFVMSVAQWLKKSHGVENKKQFQDFFKNEDNSSMLAFNDLLTQKQQQEQVHQNNLTYHMQNDIELQELKQVVLDLKQELEQKEETIQQAHDLLEASKEQLESQESYFNGEITNQLQQYQAVIQNKDAEIEQYQKEINKLQASYKQLEQLIIQKDTHIKQLEEQISTKQHQFDQQIKQNQHHFGSQIEQLKDSISQEWQLKMKKLDQEHDDLEKQRITLREESDKKVKEIETSYKKRLEQQEKEFRDKLQNMEKDVRNGCEKSKDEVVTNIYKEMEEQYTNKIKSTKEEHTNQVIQLKQEHQKQLDEAKRVKDREIKRMKEESERAKKSFDEKIKKYQQDIINEKESNEVEIKNKIDELQQKHKKDIKAHQDKIRAEMRNQVDSIKNESIKTKAEWEREKKKMASEYQQQVDQIQKGLEEQLDEELKTQKESIEKQFKKKIDEKDKFYKEQIESYELEIQELVSTHKEEVKREKERLENRLKEQLRNDVKFEVREELEDEYRQELDKAQLKFQRDLDIVKTRYEQVLQDERFEQTLQIKSLKNAEIQCDLTGNQTDRVRQSVNQSILSQITHSENYIEQLKYNFEKDLERQQQVFEMQLVQKQQVTVRIFEELIMLECKKILDSIFYKSGPSTNVKELEIKRREANSLINDILNRSDDRQEKQMKASLDSIKIKICEVLRLYKESLEAKMAQNKTQEQPFRGVQHSINGAIELSHNISRTSMSNVEFKSEYGESDIQSLAPTPRAFNKPKEERSIQIKKEFEQYLNQQNSGTKNQYSDIKKYIEYNDDNNGHQENILKKVTPLPNQKGVVMVEVEKVVRDIKMLQQTIQQSKFYRLLNPSEENFAKGIDESQEVNKIAMSGNNENTLQNYRLLLNELMKIIIKLNKGVDTLGKQQEVFKLKLLNTELKEQIFKFQQEEQSKLKQVKAEEIINYYSNRQNILTESAQECLQRLEQNQFQINKLQFNLFQLCDLFLVSNQSNMGTDIINNNVFEVAQKCKDYISQYPEDLFASQDKHLKFSQNSPSHQKISPEMLSPEETAQLIANVFQKLNTAQTNVFETTGLTNNQLDTHQSFFNTFLSNDEYKKSAENFIKQYRECQKMNQTYRTSASRSNLPLQKSSDNFNNRHHQLPPTAQSFQQTDVPLQLQDKKRSHSQTLKSNNSCYLPSPHYVSNVFQSNMLDKQSINSHQPQLFENQSQNSFLKSNFQQDTQLNNPSFIQYAPNQQQQQNSYYYQQSQQNNMPMYNPPFGIPMNSSHNMSQKTLNPTSDVANAQQNVNALFDQLKLNFNAPQLQKEGFLQ